MKKGYLKKFSSFEEMNKFDIKYDFSLTPEERLDITQFLREQYYKIKQIKPERMKKVIKIITKDELNDNRKKDIPGREKDKIDYRNLHEYKNNKRRQYA